MLLRKPELQKQVSAVVFLGLLSANRGGLWLRVSVQRPPEQLWRMSADCRAAPAAAVGPDALENHSSFPTWEHKHL